MRQLEASGAFLDDPEVNAYLDQLGHRLVSSSAEITGSFAFFAIDSPEINAFALPGGYVGVNSGLILATNNESELASVLAHEISHITQQHVARQLQAQSGSQIAALAGCWPPWWPPAAAMAKWPAQRSRVSPPASSRVRSTSLARTRRRRIASASSC